MENELSVVARHTTRAPIDLESMFSELGIEFSKQHIWSGESGWIERDGERYRVVVNASEPEARQRFTAAHELAHYLLHRDLMDHGARMNRHTDRLFGQPVEAEESLFKPHHEVQANRLAAQIIMPASLVRSRRAEGLTTTALAEVFGVSRPAMEVRLKTLGLAD